MTKYIVVHSGARDQYKLAESLLKNGKLGFLVTDDILFRKSYKKLFPKQFIRVPLLSLLLKLFLKFYNFGERYKQYNNYVLGKAAGKLSRRYGMPLIALQEYAYYAFKQTNIRPRIVFQYHPQALANKKIFEDEIMRHPEIVSFKNEIAIYNQRKLKEASEEMNLADYFIAASSFTKQTLISQMGEKKKPVFVAPYGVDTRSYPLKKRDIPTRVSFVFVGAFVERKGLFYLLNAAKRLENEGYDFCLQMTGRCAFPQGLLEKYKLKNLLVHSNLSHSDLIDLLHNSDVFVFPSLFEGFAFVIIEAMSTGLPVITTPRTIGLDVITDGEEGFIVEPSNEEALYKRMKFFVLHPECCQRMGEKAAKKANELTWENFENKVLEALTSIEEDVIC